MAVAIPDYIVKASSASQLVTLVASATAFALRDAAGNPAFGSGPDPAYHLQTQEINTSSATLLIAVIAGYANDLSGGPFDSKGNLWIQLGSESSGPPGVLIYYCIDPIIAVDHTFGRGENTVLQDTLLMIFAFGGPRFVFDGSESAHVSGGSSIQPGAIMPQESNELFVTAAATGISGISLGIDSEFTMQASRGYASGPTERHYGGAFAWKEQAGVRSQENPVWSISPVADVPAVLGCFKRKRGAGGIPDYIVKASGGTGKAPSAAFPDYIVKAVG